MLQTIGTGVLGHLNFSPVLTFRGAVGSTGRFLEAGGVVGGLAQGRRPMGSVEWGLF